MEEISNSKDKFEGKRKTKENLQISNIRNSKDELQFFWGGQKINYIRKTYLLCDMLNFYH